MAKKTANVLLAHGSSDPRWQQPFVSLTDVVAATIGKDTHIELAYMELCEPSLNQVAEKLSQQGYEHIEIYPVFFAAGRHLRKDVPAQLEALEKELNLTTCLHPPVGQAPEVKQAIANVIAEKI